jgi:hypothetical protein
LHQHGLRGGRASERIELLKCAINREVRRDHSRAGVFGHGRGFLIQHANIFAQAREIGVRLVTRTQRVRGIHKVREVGVRPRELRHRVGRARAAADLECRIGDAVFVGGDHHVERDLLVLRQGGAIDRAQLAQRVLDDAAISARALLR